VTTHGQHADRKNDRRCSFHGLLPLVEAKPIAAPLPFDENPNAFLRFRWREKLFYAGTVA
jgi:hypothetical protein